MYSNGISRIVQKKSDKRRRLTKRRGRPEKNAAPVDKKKQIQKECRGQRGTKRGNNDSEKEITRPADVGEAFSNGNR